MLNKKYIIKSMLVMILLLFVGNAFCEIRAGSINIKKNTPPAVIKPVPAPNAAAPSAPSSADEIMSRANFAAYYLGRDYRADVRMTITNPMGNTLTRDLIVLRMNRAGERKLYIYIDLPIDMRGMAFLILKHINNNEERWTYFPIIGMVQRISPVDKRSTFVGSNFFYEDLSGRDANADFHTLSNAAGGFYEIKNVPKVPSTVRFSYYNTLVDKNTLLPMRTEYYDKNNTKYRIVEIMTFDTIQRNPTITRIRASDLTMKTFTTMDFTNIQYNIGIPSDIFTLKNLRKPSPKWLRAR